MAKKEELMIVDTSNIVRDLLYAKQWFFENGNKPGE